MASLHLQFIVTLPSGNEMMRIVPKSSGRASLLIGFSKAGAAGILPKLDIDAVSEALWNINFYAPEQRNKKTERYLLLTKCTFCT
jgi:hypothetical protein